MLLATNSNLGIPTVVPDISVEPDNGLKSMYPSAAEYKPNAAFNWLFDPFL